MLAARGEVGLRRGDEPVALLLDRPPVLGVGDEILERAEGISLLADVRQDALLDVVELGRRLAEALPARAVREEPVVQLVRRTDALALDRLRDAVGTVREHAVHAG